MGSSISPQDSERRNAEAEALVARLKVENPDPSDYVAALERQLMERLRVNLGLVAEIAHWKTNHNAQVGRKRVAAQYRDEFAVEVKALRERLDNLALLLEAHDPAS